MTLYQWSFIDTVHYWSKGKQNNDLIQRKRDKRNWEIDRERLREKHGERETGREK